MTAQPALPPPAAQPATAASHAIYLAVEGCEAATARVAPPAGLRLACLPVEAAATVPAAA